MFSHNVRYSWQFHLGIAGAVQRLLGYGRVVSSGQHIPAPCNYTSTSWLPIIMQINEGGQRKKLMPYTEKKTILSHEDSKTPYILNMSDVIFPSPTPNNPFPSLRTVYMPYLACQIVSTLLGGDVDLSQHFSHRGHSTKVTKFQRDSWQRGEGWLHLWIL